MHNLDYLFHPRSIAIVGVSANPGNWGGGVWPQVLQEMGFSGNLYRINPECNQLKNENVYPSLKDIPGSVDLAIVSVPASGVPPIIEDCVAKGVKVVHIFSAGFRESGEKGARLESEITEIANRGGVRILGPNCMGVYCPAEGLSWRPDFPKESGGLAFLSQSGFNATILLKQAEIRGIRFSKLISFGNACDLDETDFLEFLASDPETKIIAAYIEGVKNGQRFFRLLRELVKTKPVILLKAGRTEAGGRAATSHTGTLANNDIIWNSLFKQTGAIRADTIEELIDTVVAFLFMPSLRNRKTALIGFGGGQGVLGADYCVSAGLVIPLLPSSVREELSRFTPKAGTSLANPIDVAMSWAASDWYKAIGIIGNSKQVDVLIVHLGMTFQHLIPGGREILKDINAAILSAAKELDIPAAIVLYSAKELEEVALEERERFIKAGFPVFHSLSSATRAIGKLIQYQDYQYSLTKTHS